MFGYVVVDKPSLRIREYDYYKATYCGLCHAMGKCTGCISRLTLSYDMTFFALLRGMLLEENVEFEKKRCVRHPLKSVNTVKVNSQLEYSAFVGGILTSGKIEDNINDERGAKRLAARLLRAFFSGMDKRSSAALPEISAIVRKGLDELSELEKVKTPSIDAPADVFGDMMAQLLAFGLESDKALIARSIGKRLGRWIYMVDALDDYSDDAKSGSYNPFVLLYGGEDFTPDNLKSISSMLEAEMALVCSALDLLDDDADNSRREVIKKILCIGMPSGVKRICEKQKMSN